MIPNHPKYTFWSDLAPKAFPTLPHWFSIRTFLSHHWGSYLSLPLLEISNNKNNNKKSVAFSIRTSFDTVIPKICLCCINYMILEKLFNLSQRSSINEYNSTYLLGVLWRINDKINVKCLLQCLVHGNCSVNVGNYLCNFHFSWFLCFLQSG